LHTPGHLVGKFQGLAGNDAHQTEEGDQDEQQQDEAGEGGGQGPPSPQQPAEAQVKGSGGKKEHQGQEDINQIGFDDEI